MNYRVWIYGGVLAVLAILLNFINYFYLIRVFSIKLYIVLIALVFTGVGIWAGRKLVSPVNQRDEFTVNTKALESLGITERELEVLKLIADGCSNKQIADQLYISIHTVKSHVSSLLSKMHVDRRTQVVKKAKSLRLIP